ncbi:MAG TPA: class I SAM-dependent methyltransferase [Stellaceae bacterium]|nr:class I SAM-dependent methyltransferase [Stellaceae bacterium]
MNAAAAPHPRRRPRCLAAPFFADPARRRMKNSGDPAASRAAFQRAPLRNLDFLLRQRYRWMQRWIAPDHIVIELGAGAGLSPRYLPHPPILSDVIANPWLDVAMDAARLALGDASIDVMIVSNALHHFPSPAQFLHEAVRVLRPGGLILLNEAYCSLLLRLLLRLMQHEGYSWDVDIFAANSSANDLKDPWSGNNAVSNLLFDCRDEFEERFPRLRILDDAPCESLLFLASGGVTSQVGMPALPAPVLHGIAALDALLVAVAPRLFALSRRTVLQKTDGRSARR